MQFPRLLVVRQKFPDRKIPDVAAAVRSQLAASGFAGRLKPGSRVAIGVGSRGIHNIATIVRNVVQYWKEQGMHPFLFPAMGSHGAASAAGQAEVLAHYGITEATMGCPLISQLEVVSLGKTADGIEAFMDKMAYDSDGVMLVGRVKWHTDFAGKIESGLFKMMAIGLGKFAGAQRYHSYAYRLGLEHVIRSVGRQVLKSGKILGGLAILEDAYHNTAKLDAVPVEAMEQREEENLALVKSWMAKIPMDLDILILDEIGKNISGAGMDTKVANRGVNGEYNPWPNTPKFQRLFLRNLSEHTYNSSVGMGMADVVTDRLVNRINWEPTWINSLTANTPAAIRTPIHFPTDRECIERIAPTVGRLDLSEVTFGWIRNTMELTRIAVSENVKAEVEKNGELEIEATIDFDFDGEGNLISPFIPMEETAGALRDASLHEGIGGRKSLNRGAFAEHVLNKAVPAIVCLCILSTRPASLQAADKPILMREYKVGSPALADVSRDGHRILAQGSREIPCRISPKCRVEVLAVYDAKTGVLVGELVSRDQERFQGLRFAGDDAVTGLSSRYDASTKVTTTSEFRWLFVSGERNDAPWPASPKSWISCQLPNHRFLGMAATETNSKLLQLKLFREDHPIYFQHPPISWSYDSPNPGMPAVFSVMERNCRQWRSGDQYLFKVSALANELHWVSTDGAQPPRLCRSFPGERIHGFALSEDGSLLSVITGAGDLPVASAGYRITLNVLDGRTCELRSRLSLEIPEKPGRTGPLLDPRAWPNNYAFLAQFATQIAISPDLTKLAVAYGMFKSPDGVAFFGIYSLSDGRRLTTIRADTYRGGVWNAIFHSTDVIWANSAPLTGVLMFTPDSRELFATSSHIYQWDISMLQ